MTSVLLPPVALGCALAVFLLSDDTRLPDRRVVDTVEVGNAQSDDKHGYDGSAVVTGEAGGTTFRQTRGWIHYAMTTFDDTEVTIACTFVRPDSGDDVPRTYELVVEDSVIATRTVAVPSSAPITVEMAVPFALTKGKTRIVVVLRARGGLTPALRQLRTIQDHYELQHDLHIDVVHDVDRLSTSSPVTR